MKSQERYVSTLRNMLREWRWILGYVNRYRFTVLLYIVLGITGTVMSLGTAVASKFLIDAVVSKYDNKLFEYAAVTVGLALFQFVFSAAASWISAVIGTKVNNEIREEIYSNILKSKWEDIHSFHSGDLLNRIEGDAAAVSNGVISFIPGAVTKLLQFFGSLIIVLYYDKVMALISLLSAPFLFLASRILIKTMRKYNAASRDLNGKVISFSEESIRNIHIIKAFDLTASYINNFRKTIDAYRSVKLSYEKFSVVTTFILSVIGLAVSYACYGWGVYRLWQGAITFGTMTLFLQISGGLSSSFSALASLVPSAVSIATSAGRIMEVTSYEKEADSDRRLALEILEKSKNSPVTVCMENVTFTYSDGGSAVLNNVSLRASSGETVALVGPSGEGKTTVLKLLLGLTEPDSGTITISAGGEKIKVSDSTRRFFSYVPQETGMFSGTVADNLRAVNASAEDSELLEALEQTEMADFIGSLSEGIYSQLGEMGGNVSAGQAQRLAIARALLKKAPILLLDEATGSLDPETEDKVLRNIMTHNPAQICILTTHRESMLRYCDRIYRVNSDGSVTAADFKTEL